MADGAMRTPVFVVGAQRSGTTLLRNLLDRHPQIAMWGVESDFFRRVHERRSTFGDPADIRNRERIVKAFLAIEPMRRTGLDLASLEKAMLVEGDTWPALFAATLRYNANVQGKPYWGEKTPANVFHVDTLRSWYPGCAIIHIVRDPRDMVSSLVRMRWSNRSVLFAARAWKRFNAAAIGKDLLLVKYEELVSSPERVLQEICRYIGVAYDPLMQRPKETVHVAQPEGVRATTPISTDRMGLWREALRPWQIAAIEAAAGPLMDEFGYARASLPATAMDMAKARAEEVLEVGLQAATRIPCTFFRYLQPVNLEAERRWIARASAMYWSIRPQPKG
jgi:hypothetical protein